MTSTARTAPKRVARKLGRTQGRDDMSLWQPIETAPNDVFDVLAKSYDPVLDDFILIRFTGCIKVNDRIIWASPLQISLKYDLMECGVRPVYWMPLPAPPAK